MILNKKILTLMLFVGLTGFASEVDDSQYLCGDFTWVYYSIERSHNWPISFSVIYPKGTQIDLDLSNIETLVESAVSSGHLSSDCISHKGIYRKMFDCWERRIATDAFLDWKLMISYNKGEYYTKMPNLSLRTGETVEIGGFNVSGCFIQGCNPCKTSYSYDIEFYLGQDLSLYSPIALFDFAKPDSIIYSTNYSLWQESQ